MAEQDTVSPFFEGGLLSEVVDIDTDTDKCDKEPSNLEDEKKSHTTEIVNDSSSIQSRISTNSVQESEYAKLKKFLPTSKKHMSILLDLYKFCFELHSIGKEKTTDEVVEEIASLGSNLDIGKIFAKQLEELKKQELDRRLFGKRIEQIPNFIKYAYTYYVWHLDNTAPICRLPTTLTKYRLISKVLNESNTEEVSESTNTTLEQLFEELITDKFIADLRVEQPPFLIRTDLQPEEIKQKIETTVKPLCKKVLAALLKL